MLSCRLVRFAASVLRAEGVVLEHFEGFFRALGLKGVKVWWLKAQQSS